MEYARQDALPLSWHVMQPQVTPGALLWVQALLLPSWLVTRHMEYARLPVLPCCLDQLREARRRHIQQQMSGQCPEACQARKMDLINLATSLWGDTKNARGMMEPEG